MHLVDADPSGWVLSYGVAYPSVKERKGVAFAGCKVEGKIECYMRIAKIDDIEATEVATVAWAYALMKALNPNVIFDFSLFEPLIAWREGWVSEYLQLQR